MKNITKNTLSTSFLLLVASSLTIHSHADSSALKCVGITEDKQRLACYDAYFNQLINKAIVEEVNSANQKQATKSTTKQTAVDSKQTSIDVPLPAVAEAPSVSPKVIGDAQSTPPTTPVTPTTSVTVPPIKAQSIEPTTAPNIAIQKTDQLFGFESQVTTITPDTIESVAIGKFKEWKKKMRIKLQNGQVWRVTSLKKVYHKAENPKVVISKGALGSFFMKVGNLNSRIRVKRIK